MNANYADILSAALALPPAERLQLVSQIQGSITDNEGDPAIEAMGKPPGWSIHDPGFGPELDRRVADYDVGRTTGDAWENVRVRIEETLRSKRSS